MFFLEINFIDLNFNDVIDIILVAYLLFVLYKLIRGSVAINIFIGLISVYFIWKFVGFMHMRMLGEILGQFLSVGVLALIIVFQQEIRKFLLIIGTANYRRNRKLGFFKLFTSKDDKLIDLESILQSCTFFSENKTGALIVFTSTNDLDNIIENSVKIDSKISSPLIESIFFKNSPLHDGAVIINSNKIKAARCVLPLTNNPQFPVDLGLRHRASVGITEHTDAICLVVSEQTGNISVAENGKLYQNLPIEKIKELILDRLNYRS